MQQNPSIRLSELSAKVRSVLDGTFRYLTFWVIADVTNHQYKEQKNYHGFELVEKDPNSDGMLAKFVSKAWGKGAVQIQHFELITGQRFTNNIQVLAQVSVVYHPLYGLSLDLLDLDTNYTVGRIFEQRALTLEKLVAENDFIQKIGDNYLTRNKQLKLTAVIQRIAIISSLTSAGMEDFKHCLHSNPQGYKFEVDEYLTVVQGESNAHQLVDRLIAVYKSGKLYDAVIMIRGGGAQTDFLIFDNYKISQAVAKFPIPIITGIGHQKNETITDLMAHTATKTPTQAAEFIIAHNRRFEDGLIHMQQKILIRSQQLLASQNQGLSALNAILVNKTRTILKDQDYFLISLRQHLKENTLRQFYGYENRVQLISGDIREKARFLMGHREGELKNITQEIKTWTEVYLKTRKTALNNHQSIIRIMSPANILKKGFAIVKVNQKIICSADGIPIGSTISILLGAADIAATVQQKTPYNGKEFDI